MVSIILADGFEEIEAVTPIDLLRRADIPVTILGLEARTGFVRGAHDINIAIDSPLNEYHPTELPRCLILPGGMPGADNLFRSDAVHTLLKRVHEATGLICAICAAPAVVLAPLGYLKGKRFTCYPTYKDKISDGKYQEQAVVRDGTLITSRGAGTAAAFSAEIITQLKDTQTAKNIMSATIQPTP